MKYELTFLIKDEAALKETKDIIASFKGKVTKEERWGERTLAYSINKNHTAVFYNYRLELDKKNVMALKNKFNLNEKILRYLLLNRE